MLIQSCVCPGAHWQSCFLSIYYDYIFSIRHEVLEKGGEIIRSLLSFFIDVRERCFGKLVLYLVSELLYSTCNETFPDHFTRAWLC